MKWNDYISHFEKMAQYHGYDTDYIDRCLKYASKLYLQGLPIIYDQKHLSQLVGYSYSYLRAAAQSPQRFYRYFAIDKKTHGVREIAEPLPNLKNTQLWILKNILYSCQPSNYAKGFVPGRSIKDNAHFHRQQSQVLSLDLKNFFSCIPATKIYQFYKKLGYCKQVAVILTKLCTLDQVLPQGAPTSPALSNLTSLNLDKRLAGYAIKNNLRYTRYADDLTFSGEFNPNSVIHFVANVLRDEKLALNKEKIKLMPRYKRQEVTGIVVNEKMQVPRPMRRELRQAIYYIEKYGLLSHIQQKEPEQKNYLDHLFGITNFILFVNPSDKDAHKAYQLLSHYKNNHVAMTS